MSFPDSYTLVTVNGQIDEFPGGGGPGTARFTAAPAALLGDSVVPQIDVFESFDTDGTFSVDLPATNDPDWSPTGWNYVVHIQLGARDIRGTLQLDYQTTEVNLHDLLQVDGTTEAGVSYILTSQRSVAGGVAGLDDDGDVIDADGAKVTGEGGGAAPGSTVVSETTYGQTATAGTGTAYSRATHSHGTPALPSAADVGADASGTAASAVSTHVGESDPHTQYALEESLGGAALLDVGTTAGTVAAGDDSRIAGAAQKASNLSDLASASSARTSLGLGGAAVLDVGTGSGDVAAGDAPAAAVTTHEAASDPHPQYAVIMLDTDGTYAAADDAVIYVGDTEPTSPADGSVWIPAS